ncbi:unnamed protein product, partial [marine sediment metagenome]
MKDLFYYTLQPSEEDLGVHEDPLILEVMDAKGYVR